VFLTKEVDGMVAKLPSATRNMYVDGESPISNFYVQASPSSSSHVASLTRNQEGDRNLGSQRDDEVKREIANDQAPRQGLINICG